jgi:hypothetical protein
MSLAQCVWKNEVAWLVPYIPFWLWLKTTWVLPFAGGSERVITPRRSTA